ncbi:cbb3-type cytochrome oxidase subunit 3 [Vibrio marisflavi]|uniref:Uncharacterized protein n=1 Tax=Vibrio marisflavi CECT 7928 TaxID=634439 RepID=A0ABM9A4Z1_9VIBR|nr:cbb3-type cytochrome oxidase subunit 3 [Vibrio marisflavi]CAH0539853.1 hypothetical protein VMF7928_02491 [Vibrio marisflavi CECT 7928]
MDIGTIHSIWTVLLFVCFVGVVWWAFGSKRKARFEQDAKMIFDEDDKEKSSTKEGENKQ